MRQLCNRLTRVRDPRRQWGNIKYELPYILFIMIVGVALNRTSYRGIRDTAIRSMNVLEQFFDTSCGIPSDDTIGRVVSLLNPDEMKMLICCMSVIAKKHIAIDGKKIRRTSKMVVTAWDVQAKRVVEQIIVPDNTNEITGAKMLLNNLECYKCIITMDAMHCQRDIIDMIVNSNNCDYIIAVKGNQKFLYRDLQKFLDENPPEFTNESTEYNRGRVENREYRFTVNVQDMPGFSQWTGMKSAGYVFKRTYNKTTHKDAIEVRYYISSIDNIDDFIRCIRNHWLIENQLHWQLDVVFGEDNCRIRKGNAPENWNILRKLILCAYYRLKDKNESVVSIMERVQEDKEALVQLLSLTV